jgi:hypothetical protein
MSSRQQQKQIPYGNDKPEKQRQKQKQQQQQRQRQIPCGNDKEKSYLPLFAVV